LEAFYYSIGDSLPAVMSVPILFYSDEEVWEQVYHLIFKYRSCGNKEPFFHWIAESIKNSWPINHKHIFLDRLFSALSQRKQKDDVICGFLLHLRYAHQQKAFIDICSEDLAQYIINLKQKINQQVEIGSTAHSLSI
jgi:hypothetical protein